MHAMYDLKKMLCKELDEFAQKGELSAGDLDAVDKLTHSIKSIVTIMAMEDSGYSNDDGYSNARRRDSMGRYADGYSGRYYDGENSEGGYSGRRYSDGGYSGRRYSRDEGKSHMMHQLEKLMDNASTQEDREILQSALNKLKNM